MNLSKSRTSGIVMAVACILALAMTSAAGASEPIKKGVDVWMTVAGFARTTFADEPIPAGFFCQDSQPFTGTLTMKGVPLAVTPGKGLGGIDTVVRRLDDAVFNDQGEASTRIQLMALSLASTQPLETSCGRFDVAATLAPGEQPVTTMRIFRTNALGGTYSAPLSLNVRLVFTPAGGDKSTRRELIRHVDLGPANHSVWAYVTTPRYLDGAMIDTRGDGHADTLLPKPSNFQAGVQAAILRGDPPKARQAQILTHNGCEVPPQEPPPDFICSHGTCPWPTCHCNPDSTDRFEPNGSCDPSHLHCLWVCYTP